MAAERDGGGWASRSQEPTVVSSVSLSGLIDHRHNPWPERFAHPGAVVAAATAHALVLFAMLPYPVDRLGEDSSQLESIAVSIVADLTVAVGEQQRIVSPTRADEAAAQPEKVEPDHREQPPKAAALDLPPDPELSPLDGPALSAAEREPPQPEPPLPEWKAEKKRAQTEPRPSELHAIAAPLPQVAAPARAGVLREYAKRVAVTLTKTKPRGFGFTGTVKLRFVVDATGRIDAVTVVAPSGTPVVDEMAVKALSGSELPPPPSGMTLTQRTFEVPYTFR